jgi:la-related protein 1
MRPPPPDQSQPVGGYKVPDIGAGIRNGVTGRGERPVVFGSIGIPGASKCPSPAPAGDGENRTAADEDEKPFATFSIGVGPGDAAPLRVRSRTVSSKARSRTATVSEMRGEVRSSVGVVSAEEAKVIDLTDSKESKWEFGTVAAAPSSLKDHDGQAAVGSEPPSSNSSQIDDRVMSLDYEPLPPVLPSIAGFESPLQPTQALQQSPLQHLQILGQLSGTLSGQLHSQSSVTPPVLLSEAAGDEFEVKDYGYGFGPVSGTGFAETITRAERAQREREHQVELERERNAQFISDILLPEERELRRTAADRDLDLEKPPRETDYPPRSRRGGYHGGHERAPSGGFGGRRGRGVNGFGRGYNRRGGGGFHQPPLQHSRHPPFSVTPPQTHFQPLMPMGEPPNGFYPQSRPQLTTYIPTGYDTYPQPPPLNTATAARQITAPVPVPVPISPISFPLDPTRWYLLGQLEYYLSPQNMAQDFFLRQRVSRSCNFLRIY